MSKDTIDALIGIVVALLFICVLSGIVIHVLS